jgi:hypothetical protein
LDFTFARTLTLFSNTLPFKVKLDYMRQFNQNSLPFKIFSLFLCLFAGLNGFSQQLPRPYQRPYLTRAERLHRLEQKDQNLLLNTQARLPQAAPLRKNPSTSAISAVSYSDLGQSVNPYSVYGTGMNCISAAPALNSVAFIRRGGPQDEGGQTGAPGNKLFFDLNTSLGSGSWRISRGPLFNDDAYINRPNYDASGTTGSNYGSRYPQGGIWNPAGNTDTANALVLGIPRVLDGSNGAVGGIGTGWKKLAATAPFGQNLETSTAALPNNKTESMEVTGSAIFVTAPIETISGNNILFTDKIAVYKYEYNQVSNQLSRTVSFLPFPNEGGSYKTTVANSAIAFGPDGQTGFVMISAANNAFDSVAAYIPYIAKTTDGGQSWSALEPIKINKKKGDGPNPGLDAFREKMLANLVYFNNNGIPFKANYTDAGNHKLHYVDYLVNDFDLVVDKNNDAHVLASLVISGFGDTLNATFPNGITYNPGYGSWNMHLYFSDLQSPVKGELINQNQGLNGCWGDCNGSDFFLEANRPQASRSEDGSVLAFAWYDTDKFAHPQLDTANNGNPDLWIQRIRVGNAGEYFYGERPRNITKGSDYDGMAALGNVAPRLLNKPGGGYLLASTLSAFAPFNPATGTGQMTTQHIYVNNVSIPAAADSFQVQVQGVLLNANSSVLATIFTSPVDSIQSNSAVSGGNVIFEGGGLPVSARGVCWNTNPQPTVDLNTKTVDGSGSGSFSSSITGLSPQTTYYVRAYATNGGGTSYGPQRTFTTLVNSAIRNELKGGISVVPNPGTGLFYFRGIESGAALILQTAAGKEVLRRKIAANGFLDISGFPSGIYLYSLQTPSGLYRGKLIRQ